MCVCAHGAVARAERTRPARSWCVLTCRACHGVRARRSITSESSDGGPARSRGVAQKSNRFVSPTNLTKSRDALIQKHAAGAASGSRTHENRMPILAMPHSNDVAAKHSPPCITFGGLFTSGCGRSFTLNNCSAAILNGEYEPIPAVAPLPPRTLSSATMKAARKTDSAVFAIKAEKGNGNELERHPRVDKARVSNVVPLVGRCLLAGSTSSIFVTQWVDAVPCMSLLHGTTTVGEGNEHAHALRLLHSSVQFFMDMVFNARLVDIDRNVNRNTLCQNISQCAGSAVENWRCQPLLHHDFDGSEMLQRDWLAPDAIGGQLDGDGANGNHSQGGAGVRSREYHTMSGITAVRWMLFETVTWPALLLDVWFPWSPPHSGSPSWRHAAERMLVDRCGRVADRVERSPCAKLVACVKAEPSQSELQALTSPSSSGPKGEAGRVDFMRRVFDRGLVACERGGA